MEDNDLQELLCNSLCQSFTLFREAPDRWTVQTPFAFPDGDGFVVLLERLPEAWAFRDEGHTLFHLANLGVELDTPARQERFDSVLRLSGVEYDQGEIRLLCREETLGMSLLRFLSVLQQVTDLRFLTREVVRRVFRDDVEKALAKVLPTKAVTPNYVSKEIDPRALYKVDFRLERPRAPVFLFAVNNDDRCRDATVSIYWFERKGVPFVPVGVFEDEGVISRGVHERFAEACPHRLYRLDEPRLRKTLVEDLQVALDNGNS